MKILLLIVACAVGLIASDANACSCSVAYRVPSSAGDVTITKIKVSSVQVTFPGIYITLPYGTKWRGSTKVRAGHKTTFKFNVTSNCENGTRQFAFTRKDGKTCYKEYPDANHPYDRCGLNTSSRTRSAPVVSCDPDEWRTSSPR